MPKEIKKHYHFMDLSYSSTIDEIKEREKVMIKILRAKAIKKRKSFNDKIEQIVNSTNEIVEYVEKNGVPNVQDSTFVTPKNNIFTQLFILLTLIIVLVCSIFALI